MININTKILTATVIFQFAILLGLFAIIGFQLWQGNGVNEVVLGAIIGTFTGVPQALITLMNADDEVIEDDV